MTSTIRPRPTPHRLHLPASDARREMATFALIGVASTIAYAGIYLALRTAMPAAWANVLALLITAVGNTAANRRLTFGVRGRRNLGRDHIAGLIALMAAVALTTGALGLLSAVAPAAPRKVELAVLLASQVGATLLRFLILRAWLRRPGGAGASTED